eukprot:GILJ01002858.1.p1 GENE.GILJ01002858.1~~GILJ01002858.1.p1  ORF type:complete len:173 (+),score=17.19 GILJ01002858.1:53-520(+)
MMHRKPQSRRINFYREGDEYGQFSNFWKAEITLNGKTWPTTEHYFQALKFSGTEHEELVRQASSPKEAADMGRDRSLPLRANWEELKDMVMYAACYAKFTQHADLRQLLLDTGDAYLVEHTRNDRYWGDGGDGTGRNQLGKTLMLIRDRIRAESQ